MATIHQPLPPQYTAEELELARDGVLRLRTRDIADVLKEIGTLPLPAGDAGSRALDDVRGDRV
ncbi:hypothetical protein GKE82_15385 [Conexibacter sp. W3-3-2]|uniref:hypothetical protein n=1 Tax=Conexibacter sp. W3-3-2 TaxID=2675227 RepID=UPI0012BA1190|nr:hypothetical protein [Conexibacter sp. W3-3-2]MTD45631.1 hypothetical protein [Conexibacter sp. W3-3-2]